MYKLFKISGNTQNFPEFEQFHKLSTEFLPFAQKKLGFDKPINVNLMSDPQNAKDPLGKTAYYEPEKMKITLFVDKRHVKDILRSMAHELVHHTQNCRGEFKGGLQTGKGYAQEDGHMREMEREAYEKGQMLLRDWEDGRKKRMTEAKKVVPKRIRGCPDIAPGVPWPSESPCVYKLKSGAQKLINRACNALGDEKNVKRRMKLTDRGIVELKKAQKSMLVKSFEHAYQLAQCNNEVTFVYIGKRGSKRKGTEREVDEEYSTDLWELDPTRGLPPEYFDQIQKENKIMKEVKTHEGGCPAAHKDLTHTEWVEQQNEEKELLEDKGECDFEDLAKKGERGYTLGGDRRWKTSACVMQSANKDLPDWQKWKVVSGEQGNSVTIVQEKSKDGKGQRRVTMHYQTSGGQAPVSESVNWFKGNKDQLLFERLVDKWIK